MLLLFVGQAPKNPGSGRVTHSLGVALEKGLAFVLPLQGVLVNAPDVHFAPILGSGFPDSGPPHSGV
jgi:hypothetical protein